jgi:hypothetical protein
MLIVACTILSTLLSSTPPRSTAKAALTGFWLKAAAPVSFPASDAVALQRWLLAGWLLITAMPCISPRITRKNSAAKHDFISRISPCLARPACTADRQVLLRQQREKPEAFLQSVSSVPQFESAAPPYLAEPESTTEAEDGQQDTDEPYGRLMRLTTR